VKLAYALVYTLLFSTLAFGQAAPAYHNSRTQILGDVDLDAFGELGYEFPTIFAGIAVEQPIATRWEIQAQIEGGWSKKYITNNGVSLTSRLQGLFWINDRVGLSGAFATSNLWTSQFVKVLNVKELLEGIQQQELYPTAGIVMRDSFEGAAGRFYADWKFPTGCQWATPANPCKIQSSRLQGIEITQEFRMTTWMRFGGSFFVYHGLEQSNQNEPQIPRTGFWAPAISATIRFQFPGHPWDEKY
jgi:hypothetical protein